MKQNKAPCAEREIHVIFEGEKEREGGRGGKVLSNDILPCLTQCYLMLRPLLLGRWADIVFKSFSRHHPNVSARQLHRRRMG